MIRSLLDLIAWLKQNDLRTIQAAFHSRDAPAPVQFLKYAISGSAALVVHTVLYLALCYWIYPEWNRPDMNDWERARSTFPPTAIAFLFSNAFVYWLNTRWVFTPGRHSKTVEFLLFTLVNIPGALTGTLAQGALVYFWHWPKWAALAGFVIPNVLINFVCRKFLIFQR